MSAMTVSQRFKSRRNNNKIDIQVKKGSDGFDDVDAYWADDKSTSSRTTATGAASLAATTPVKRRSDAGVMDSPELSTPGFDLGGSSDGESVSGRSPRKAKTRQSIAASVGGLSEVSTPNTKRSRGSTSGRSDDNFSTGGGYEMDGQSTLFSEGYSSGRSSVSTPAPPQTPEAIRKDRELKKQLRRAAAETKKRNDEGSRIKRQKQYEADEAGDRVNYYEDQSVDNSAVGEVDKAAYLKFNPAQSTVTPETEDDGSIRRSKRFKVQPLAYWKNERIVYKPSQEKSIEKYNNAETQDEKDFIFVSRIAGTLHALKSPVKPKRAGGAKKKTGGGKAMTTFDSSLLNHNLKYLNDDKAVVWDEQAGEYKNSKIISYQSTMATTALPITADREAGKDVVGLAAQAFNVPQATEDVPGWISGHVTLPPEGIKDAEGVGMCSQVFFVSECQPKSFEVAIGAPDESTFNGETAQRFLLSAGDFFHVPPNNIYRIENHSTQHETKLFWTIIRPMANEN